MILWMLLRATSILSFLSFGSVFLWHGRTLYHFDNKDLQNPNWALQTGWRLWGTEILHFEQTIGEIFGKVLPIDPQVNPIWLWSRLDLSFQQYHIRKIWQLLTQRYLLLFPTRRVFCLRYFNLFLVEDLQVLSNDARISTYVTLES